MKIFNNNGINQLIKLVKSNDKELRTLINNKANSNHTHNEMFKSRVLNTVNIDTEYESNYVVGISGEGHGTCPTTGAWYNVINFVCNHYFATQIAWSITQSTNVNRYANLFFRERYCSDASKWTTWRELSVTGHNHDALYIKKSGDTMSGALNFANNTWNNVGDDVAIGDSNVAGTLCVKGLNADGNIRLYRQDGIKIGDVVVSEDIGNFGCRIQVGETESTVSKMPSFGFRRLSDNNSINFFAIYPKSMAYGFTDITFGSYMDSSDIRRIDIPFSFGIDSNGNYGYKKIGADTVTPFKYYENIGTINNGFRDNKNQYNFSTSANGNDVLILDKNSYNVYRYWFFSTNANMKNYINKNLTIDFITWGPTFGIKSKSVAWQFTEFTLNEMKGVNVNKFSSNEVESLKALMTIMNCNIYRLSYSGPLSEQVAGQFYRIHPTNSTISSLRALYYDRISKKFGIIT